MSVSPFCHFTLSARRPLPRQGLLPVLAMLLALTTTLAASTLTSAAVLHSTTVSLSTLTNEARSFNMSAASPAAVIAAGAYPVFYTDKFIIPYATLLLNLSALDSNTTSLNSFEYRCYDAKEVSNMTWRDPRRPEVLGTCSFDYATNDQNTTVVRIVDDRSNGANSSFLGVLNYCSMTARPLASSLEASWRCVLQHKVMHGTKRDRSLLRKLNSFDFSWNFTGVQKLPYLRTGDEAFDHRDCSAHGANYVRNPARDYICEPRAVCDSNIRRYDEDSNSCVLLAAEELRKVAFDAFAASVALTTAPLYCGPQGRYDNATEACICPRDIKCMLPGCACSRPEHYKLYEWWYNYAVQMPTSPLAISFLVERLIRIEYYADWWLVFHSPLHMALLVVLLLDFVVLCAMLYWHVRVYRPEMARRVRAELARIAEMRKEEGRALADCSDIDSSDLDDYIDDDASPTEVRYASDRRQSWVAGDDECQPRAASQETDDSATTTISSGGAKSSHSNQSGLGETCVHVGSMYTVDPVIPFEDVDKEQTTEEDDVILGPLTTVESTVSLSRITTRMNDTLTVDPSCETIVSAPPGALADAVEKYREAESGACGADGAGGSSMPGDAEPNKTFG